MTRDDSGQLRTTQNDSERLKTTRDNSEDATIHQLWLGLNYFENSNFENAKLFACKGKAIRFLE